ncbi:recombination protein Rad52, partial [Myriangium duriaei CBS 260.36]
PTDLNRPNRATTNPFEEAPPRLSEYTATQIATLQSRLDKQLGPEYISTRPGAGGGKVHYLAAEKVINLANEVFGFNGWCSAIREVQVDFVDESSSQKITLGLSIIVRVTLKDGTYHEDIGYGHIENCRGKAAAFEKAKKEAATDALKRALRNFGNVLGNCLYDKDYLAKVTKLKIAPSRWDADNLHRHPDYAPIKKESIDDTVMSEAPRPARMRSDRSAVSNATNGTTEYGEDEFGGNLFDEVDFSHPDEVRLDETTVDGDGVPDKLSASTHQTPRKPMERVQSLPDLQRRGPGGPASGPPGRVQPPQQMQRAAEQQRQQPNGYVNNMQRPAIPAGKPPGQAGPPGHVNTNGQMQRQPTPPVSNNVPQLPPGEALPGFVTGRSADKPAAQPFNPHAESPSIRRTAGVNTGKSEPVLRTSLNGPASNNSGPDASVPRPGPGPVRPNFVNPSADAHRRVGMPVAPPSPMGNRGAYKPPTAIKRPAPPESGNRTPLADTTNVAQ